MPEYCVTGGTGFIASYLVKELLLRGHQVRATVRDPGDEEKVGFLWSMEGAKERLRLMKADLLVEGSFDEALDGVDGVFHTASPVFTIGNIQESLIDPAIKGTMNVLKSCAKFSSVKRVVLTSSCSAIRYRNDSTLISPLNESHWSDTEYCKRYNLWYAYAKTLAEKEAWRLAEEYGIDLVAVNPSYVVGPLLAPHPTSTLQMILSIMKGDYALYPNTTIGFVHIDDVVSAHILAMEDSKASGRLICSSSVAHWSEIIEMLRAKYPSYPIPIKVILSHPRGLLLRHTTHRPMPASSFFVRGQLGRPCVDGLGCMGCDEKQGDSNPHSMSTSKVEELGLKSFKTITQMFDDCIQSFQKKGLL